MKKKLFLGVICCFLILGFTVGCDNNPPVNNNDGDNSTINSDNKDSKWGLQINGKSIELPCTLADLENAGVKLLIESEKENIINSTNQKFTMVPAICEEDGDTIYLTINTGSNSSKKEKNATISIITNTTINKSIFTIKNGIMLGSTIEDVIDAYGDDYVTSNKESEFNNGFVVLKYGTLKDGAMFNFRDGILNYIEFFVNQE